jgi:hypothetical protein
VRASHLLALLAVALIAALWAGVQIAWRRTFPHACSDPDVLAGRMGCHGCDTAEACERRRSERAGRAEEERS